MRTLLYAVLALALKGRGYAGVSPLGRSETWTRKSHWQSRVATMLEGER